MGSVAGGALAARQYVAAASVLDGSGNESAVSTIGGAYPDGGATAGVPVASMGASCLNGQGAIINQLALSANTKLTLQSPVAGTARSTWNAYANYMDPIIYADTSGNFPETGNWFYWDSGLTTPIFSQASGGSQPKRFLICGFTYQLPTGESINDALRTSFQIGGGNPPGPFGLASFRVYYDGSYTPITGAPYGLNGRIDHAAYYEVAANNRLTVASPPSVSGATGWNFYCALATYNGGTYLSTPLSKQNLSGPISLGTSWSEPIVGTPTGLVTSAQIMPNLLLQNASPLAIGTPFTEPNGGLANHNPNTSKLKWYRRGSIDFFGGTPDNGCTAEWWAVAPSPLTNYVIDLYPILGNLNIQGVTITASVVAIKGVTSTTWPFAAAYNAPVVSATSPQNVTFAETHAVVVGMFVGSNPGTAGSGYTQIYSHNNLNSQYEIFAFAQTGLSVAATSGNGGPMIADVIVGGAGIGVDGTATLASAANVRHGQLTISTTQPNDILILQVALDTAYAQIAAIDQDLSAPPASLLVGGAPIGIVQNNAIANFNPAATGGIYFYAGGTGGNNSLPGGYLTTANNYQFNTFNGSTFVAPLWASVIADPVQSDYDYRLASLSGAIGYGANPGANPYPTNRIGPSLAPAYELKLFGLPTPGTPIPSKTVRPNTGGVFDAGAFESGI